MQPKSVVIIGAGLVGLATAYRLLQQMPGSNVTVLEKEDGPARHQSGHNSGVIHSGIYYPPGSLKADNCLQGYRYLLDFCQQYHIAHEVCGKLIVASNEKEAAQLPLLLEKARAHQLKGVCILDSEGAKEKEPYIQADKALWVPQTGIVDFPAVASKLVELIMGMGGQVLFHQKVQQILSGDKEIFIETATDVFHAQLAVNCAGLFSDRIAQMAGLRLQHKIIPFRGEYHALSDRAAAKVKGLVYPVPNPDLPFLGVHLTRMIDGKVEAGPNAILSLKREGYHKGDFSWKDSIDALSYPGLWKMGRKYAGKGAGEMMRAMSIKAFARSVQKLLPDIEEEDLSPAPAGVRAQALLRNGQLADDFMIMHSARMIHVCNAPSPAATSCLSIGEHIAEKAIQSLNI
jgi:(S)-2-hydroxyglutarate dehydrogenase